MSDETQSVREAELSAVIASYLEAVDEGHAPAPAELLDHHPHLVAELREFLEVEGQLAQLADQRTPPVTDDQADTVSARDLPPAGAPFGSYDLLELLGEGGMGVVYKARDRRTKRIVALKLIRAGRHAAISELQRFRVEAEAAARLSHAGIVHLFEVGECEGQPFLASEFCDGGSLANKLETQTYSPQDSARTIEILAEAVQAAHDKHIIHRDLKPANVLITAEGTYKIGDFGLAKLLDAAEFVTRTNAILGSPPYMSPEQAAGKTAGKPTDVYALGAILYEMLTGNPPFRGSTPTETLRRVVRDEPVPPRRLNRAVPRDLQTICLRCLEKEPARRFATPNDLADDLGRFPRDETIVSRPVSLAERAWRWCKRNPVPCVAALVVITIASVAFGLISASRDEALDLAAAKGELVDAYAKMATEKDAQATLANQHAQTAKENADRALAHQHAAERQARERAFDQALALLELGERDKGMLALARVLTLNKPDGEPDPLEQTIRSNLAAWHDAVKPPHQYLKHPAAVARVGFSADGKRVLTMTDLPGPYGDGLMLKGGAETALMSGRFYNDIQNAQVPIGATHLHASKGGLAIFDAATGKLLPTGLPKGARTQAVSQDGKFALLAIPNPDRGGLLTYSLWDLNAGKAAGDQYTFSDIRSAAFSPNGETLLTSAGIGGHVVWETKTGKRRSIGERLLMGNGRPEAAYSQDGSFIVTWTGNNSNRGGIGLGDGGGANPFDPQRFTNPARMIGGGTRVATQNSLTGVAGKAIPSVRIGPAGTVALAPGGKTILTSHTAMIDQGVAQLWNAETGKQIGEDMAHPGFVLGALFSPDGKRVLTHSARGVVHAQMEEARLWDAATGKPLGPALPFHGMLRAAAFSPDGKLLVIGGGRFNRGEVLLWDVIKSEPRGAFLLHSALVTSVAFRQDGQQVVTGSLDGTARVWDIDRAAELEPAARTEGVVAISPDAKVVLTLGAEKLQFRTHSTGESLGVGVAVSELPRGAKRYALLPDNRSVLIQSDKDARLWDVIDGKAQGEPWAITPQLEGRLLPAAVGGSGDVLALAKSDADGDGGQFSAWNLKTGERMNPQYGSSRPVDCIAVSPDGQTLLVGATGALFQWDLGRNLFLGPDGKWSDSPVARFVLPVQATRFCPNGRVVLITGDRSGSREDARLIDLSTGKLIGSLQHQGVIRTAIFSSDGELVLTAGDDRAVRLWSVTSGRSFGSALPHRAAVIAIALKSDKSLVVTASTDRTARIWDLATRKPLGPPLAHDAAITAVAFSPLGNAIITLTERGEARTWRIPSPVTEPVELLRLRTEILTGMELDENGIERGLDAAGWQSRWTRIDELTRPSGTDRSVPRD